MRKAASIGLAVLLCIGFAKLGLAQSTDPISGEWLIARELFGNTVYHKFTLKLENGKVTGAFASGKKLEGTLQGNVLHFIARDANSTIECTGTVSGGTISGKFVETVPSDPKDVQDNPITATRMPAPRSGPPQRHEFRPTTFFREFSGSPQPVLRIWPKDTVHTTTVDAGGADEQGIRRSLGGNPETGPFYIETAWPGDTLAVRFTRIRLNRDYAISDDGIVDRAVDSDLAVKLKDTGNDVRWHLDRKAMVATSERPGDHLKNFAVPLRPMLGCVATAPGRGSVPTGDSGGFGGNMDFNEIVEGVTVYLPVNKPGALLFVGDGHAAQGDGELNGNALETSMEVEFTVDLIHNKRFSTPRVESESQIMTVGLGGSLEDALRAAISGMSQWLEQDYGLTPSEIAQVLGTSVQLSISEVADRNAGVVAKLSKQRLVALAKKQ
jgi:acetamidase/formamidase